MLFREDQDGPTLYFTRLQRVLVCSGVFNIIIKKDLCVMSGVEHK